MRCTKHGMARTKEYSVWASMIGRCENPNDRKYDLYGGRGICVAPQWRADFAVFIRDMGRRPSDQHSLDRIDPNGNYEPGNVRWATTVQQNRNLRTVLRVNYRGSEMPLPDAIDLSGSGMSRRGVLNRIARGWDIIKAIETPSQRILDRTMAA